MKGSSLALTALAGVCLFVTSSFAAIPPWKAPGANIARGKTFTVSSMGKCYDYDLTKDAGDPEQLTDGKFAPTEKHMWWYKEAVARWMGTAGFTFDLGEVKSISGVSYSTDAGPHAGIGWAPAIVIMVSDDGKEFRFAGELIGLSAKFGPPPLLGRHVFRTDELKTHARYVQFVIRSGYYILADEIEIYEGKPEYLKSEVAGPAYEKPVEYVHTNVMPYAVSARLAMDTARARAQIEAIGAPDKALKSVEAKLEELRQAAVKPELITYDRDFRAVAPMNALHAQIFAAVSPAYRAAGYPEFMAWTTSRWARLAPSDGPAAPATATNAVTLNVRLMQNDRRGEVVSIANFSDAAKTAVVSVSGLPGGDKPAYLTVKQAEYTAMPSRPWDADPLPAAESVKNGWKVSLPAGLSRQLWLDFLVKPGSCPAGVHQGELVVKVDGGPELRVPLALTVAATALPDDKAVLQGNWDYVHGGSRKNPESIGSGFVINDGNYQAAIQHMRESGVSVAWAHLQWSEKDVVPFWNSKLAFDENDQMVTPPDYSTFDRWVKSRPEVRYYALYCAAGGDWKGAKMGTDSFNRRMGTLAKHWAAHCRDIGLDPAKIVLCIYDEPAYASTARITAQWAAPIRAAVPEFKFYVDSILRQEVFNDPDVAKMMDLMDFVTPGTDYCYQRIGQPAVDFYESVRAKGKAMGFYVCAQNPSEAESTRYYRLQEWACWQINKGGPVSWSGFWSYSDTRGNLPWNQLPCGSDRNWSPVYIDSTSVTDGKHWLAIFEGVNDYEYLLILKNRIAEVRQAGRNDETVAAAEKLLAELPDEVIAAVRAGNEPIHSGAIGTIKLGDIDACDKARLRVMDALDSLATPVL